MNVNAHLVSLKGDRDCNEDRHNIIIGGKDPNTGNVDFYGIYDGHGGKFVSNFLSENIHHFFVDPSVVYPLDIKYVNKVYDGLQKVLFTKYSDNVMECGSTCLIICRFKHDGKDYINVINTGDSRAVLCRNNIAMVLTKDHKPEWHDEKARINRLGGDIVFDGHDWRINKLSVSRAFGDKSAQKYVTHRPEVYKYKITSRDHFIIMACDGLWDVCSNQEVVNFVLNNCYDGSMNRINKKINISRRLAQYAIDKGSTDNVTAIVVFLDKINDTQKNEKRDDMENAELDHEGLIQNDKPF